MMSNQFVQALALIAVLFVIAELPYVQKNFLIPMTLNSPHLVVFAEAVLGVIIAWIAARREPMKTGGKL
jgi:hypothetical protein